MLNLQFRDTRTKKTILLPKVTVTEILVQKGKVWLR